MRFFSKSEVKVVSFILLVVFAVTYINMLAAVRRTRDAQRRDDIGVIASALENYNEEFGFFPPSEEGKIMACKNDKYESNMAEIRRMDKFDRVKFFEGLRGCVWGEDTFEGIKSVYLSNLPRDPKTDDNIHYYYLSSTRRYQIFAYLEGEAEEDGYNPQIVQRNLPCGDRVCNFGVTLPFNPLDRSIEEYEEELREKDL
jgi:hypothetical protein